MKARTIHDDFDHCFCCQMPRHATKLEAAHIRKRSMGQKRLDDRRAVILLCELCHKVFDNSGFTREGVTYPPIHHGHAVWMKLRYDDQDGEEYQQEKDYQGIVPGTCVGTWEYIRDAVFEGQIEHYVLSKGITMPPKEIRGHWL